MSSVLEVIDVDQHLSEARTAWRDHIDPAFRDDALAIEQDDLGWWWLTWRGRQLFTVEHQEPHHPELIGAERLRREAGERATATYEEMVPLAYSDPAARLVELDRFGVDASVLFPNFGLTWEDVLNADLPALNANLRAYNRWMVDTLAPHRERLFGVAHLSLRDVDWAVSEIATLGAAGVRLAMVAPAPVEDKPLSHTDLDPVWAAFCDHGVSPVFHVGNFARPLHPAWYEGDPEPVDSVMGSVFLSLAPAVAIANMALHGTFERFPELRLGVVELTAGWFPTFLLHLDGASDFYTARHGRPLRALAERPSDYVLGQVRVAALAYEGPAPLVEAVGEDTFMFGSDWPHAEGIAEPRAGYERAIKTLSDTARAKVMGGNAAWLLRLEA
jgi:predicted TIM-barrel fold metal-dependent hydrolase